jgi:hypothetical protein
LERGVSCGLYGLPFPEGTNPLILSPYFLSSAKKNPKRGYKEHLLFSNVFEKSS